MALRVLNDAVAIDDECGALGNATHAEIYLREKRVIRDIVSSS